MTNNYQNVIKRSLFYCVAHFFSFAATTAAPTAAPSAAPSGPKMLPRPAPIPAALRILFFLSARPLVSPSLSGDPGP